MLPPRMITHILLSVAVVFGAAACAAKLTRNPLPEALISGAAPHGISSNIRAWGDAIDREQAGRIIRNLSARQLEYWKGDVTAGSELQLDILALSGGGANGAFGAGLLNGWSKRGDRPEFEIVTGISTGAIISVFAFLGPEYDDDLREVYTTYRTDQLFERNILDALTGGVAAARADGYRGLIERYINDDLVERLAEEHRKGRTLLIGTTNMDASRPVTWSIGAIAATGHKNAKRLIHDIVQASSAIPGAFPPVLIPVVGTDGQTYDEMHVDGGATQQVMYMSPQFPIREADRALGVRVNRTIYIVINNKLAKSYEPVTPDAMSIAMAAVSSLIGGSGTGDIYKIFAIAERDAMGLNVVSIPRDFTLEPDEPFDPVYMTALYELGFEYGTVGGRWAETPPDFVAEPGTD